MKLTTFVEVDIHAVGESKHNPRRHFDEAQLKELAESIGQVGILSPLVVRPDPHSTPKSLAYEIAAGHRRYRAAKLAKLTLLPCLVREMSEWGQAKTAVPRGKTAEELVRHLAGLLLSSRIRAYHAYEEVPKLAKMLGLDLSDVLKAEPLAQTSAKKKKAKAA